MKKVLAIDKRDGIVLGVFTSPEDASVATRVPASTIRSSAKAKTLYKKRFFFRYAEDWRGYEIFSTTINCPVIAVKDMGDGKRMLRWFSTTRELGNEIGTNTGHICNAIRNGYRVKGWRVRYAVSTVDWQITTKEEADVQHVQSA